MPKSSWASPKAMRGKCERRGGSVNVAAAGTNVIRRAMGARRGRLSAPWLQFHGAGRADVYIIIRVRASRCGESALNPPPSPPIPRRRPSLAHAQRHSLPEHFLTPFPPRRTPAGCAMHSSPTSQHIPHRRPSPAPHSDTPFPSIFSPPSRALPPAPAAQTHTLRLRDARLPTSQHIPRRRSAPAPAQRRALPEHFLTPSPRRRTPAGCAMHSSPPPQHIPRRRPPLAPAQRRALPEHFLIPFPCPPATSPQPRRTPAGCAIHSSSKAFASPSVPLRAQKKRHRTVDVRCRMSRSTVVAVGHWGW